MSSRNRAAERKAKILARAANNNKEEIRRRSNNFSGETSEKSLDEMIDTALTDVILKNNNLVIDSHKENEKSTNSNVSKKIDREKQRREARRTKILESSSQRMEKLNGDRIPREIEEKSEPNGNIELKPQVVPIMSFAKSIESKPERKISKSVSSKGSSLLSSKPLADDLLPDSNISKRKSSKLAAMANFINSYLSTFLIVYVGICVGLILLPSVITASDYFFQSQLSQQDSEDPRAMLESYFSSHHPNSDIAGSFQPKIGIVPVNYENFNMLMKLPLRIIGFIDFYITGPYGYPCLPLSLLAWFARSFSFLVIEIMFMILKIFGVCKPRVVASEGGLSAMSMVKSALPFIGKMQKVFKFMRSMISDAAFAHCVVLLTISIGLIPAILNPPQSHAKEEMIESILNNEIETIAEITVEVFETGIETVIEETPEVEFQRPITEMHLEL